MKLIKTTFAGLILTLALAIPSAASASGESAEASFKLTPQSGEFTTNSLSPAKWSVKTEISTPDPEILPMKVADLNFPAGQLTFNPKSGMPVCPDDQVGPPPVNVSVPVNTVVARCPNSVLGNGTATFVLGRNNLNPIAVLDGVMVVFNGGLQGGRPLIKVYAYSYDTTVGIYTDATLEADGSLVFNIPQLTSDSAVSSLNLAIPSRKVTLNDWGPGEETVVLPAGQDGTYVKGKCSNGSWPFTADFTLGRRDTNNNPIGLESMISDSTVESCVGVSGKPRIGSVKVKGPSKVKRNKPATYKVKIKNSGSATAKGVRLKVSGKGVSFNTSAGSIGAGKTRTVRVKAKFRKKGKVKASFKVTSSNAGGKTAKKTITVK